MFKYKHLFFDLDHTLWDFDANARETLVELYDRYFPDSPFFTEEEFIQSYFRINELMWNAYNRGKVTKQEIRTARFPAVLRELGLPDALIPAEIGDEFLRLCPMKTKVLPHAREVIQYLSERYCLHIITNGFDETQDIKLRSCGLMPFFDVVVTSETTGYLKPDSRIFGHALSKAKAPKDQSVMIGDSLLTDVLGAKAFGMDQVFYNPKDRCHSEELTYEIACLSELYDLF
ncbi:MAG: YjjG family noncanonical pyrimidine nucleotidase [Cytophagales bacterium]|nr:YjjG family noncanonical pyrimidine nucleotidase [Cytophagales bacterium]